MPVDATERIQAELIAQFGWSASDPRDPHAPWPELDRGVLATRVSAIVSTLTSQGGARATLAAEELSSILAANPGPRVPLAAFRETPVSALLASYVAPLLVNHWQAADATFDLGPVRARQAPGVGPLVSPQALADLIDEHSRTPGGILGLPATTENPVSLGAGVGPVRSRFLLEPGYFSNGREILVDVLTILDPSGSTTTVRVGLKSF